MGREQPKALDGKPTAPPAARLVSLDAYRGFTMLAMISGGLSMGHLLNHPTWGWLADQFDHREWIGCTVWDLIQPSFMFIVGTAMPFSFTQRRRQGQSWGLQFGHALKRSLLLILIGIFLDCFSESRFYVQFIRVLQQIALGYVAAFLVLYFRPRWQALGAAAILVLHTALYLWYGNLQGCWPWEAHYNIGARLDEFLLQNFGITPSLNGYVTLNALSSAATIIGGVLCGELLRSTMSDRKKLLVLVLAGVGCLGIGLALTPWVPMVKRIWTASFALYAAGWTCLFMLAFFGIIDVLKYQRWTFPLLVVGMNSIGIYTITGTFKSTIKRGLTPFLGPPFNQVDLGVCVAVGVLALAGLFLKRLPAALRALLAVIALMLWAAHFYREPLAAPVIMAALVVLVMWGICYWLYRHRIFFKV